MGGAGAIDLEARSGRCSLHPQRPDVGAGAETVREDGAAMDLADQGHRVYLVEKEPSIGGIMAQLDKTYPTMDCSI